MRKTSFRIIPIVVLIAALWAATGCNKDLSRGSSSTTDSAGISTSSTISVTVNSSGTVDSTGSDSVLIYQPCGNGYYRDSIAASALPDSVTAYLTAQYSGYTLLKAFAVKDNSGTIVGYVAVIEYNGKPVGLLFDAKGNALRVLQQMDGGGHHHFGRRDRGHPDTVALSALPSAITGYFTSNYSGDTLLQAYINPDSSYVVYSKNSDGLFVTEFSSTGAFERRIELPSPPDVSVTQIDSTALPAAATTWLTSHFPDYSFDNAYALTINGTTAGYAVLIDANNTKYAVRFDGSGNFLEANVVW